MIALTESFESYKHKAAKQVLAGWLREASKDAGYDRHLNLWGMDWTVNRSEPTWGIYEEYPIAPSICNFWSKTVAAWDETKWLGIPTRDELIADGDYPDCILDIAIQEKGRIVYGFEVLHSSPVSDRKWQLLSHLNIEVREIEAEWILRQVRRPESLKVLARHGVSGGSVANGS